MENLFKKRRKYVNEEFGKAVTGKKLSNRERSKILKKLWKEAKEKYK